MTSKKLNQAYITNDATRKSSFQKRKKGIFKRAGELSVLCDVEACVVINSPYSPTPEVWPSVEGVKHAVKRFNNMSEVEQAAKMVNHETFIKQSIDKVKVNIFKRIKENQEKTMKAVMFQLIEGKGETLNLSVDNRIDLVTYIQKYINTLHRHMKQTLSQPQVEVGESSSAADVMVPNAIAEGGSSSIPTADVMVPNAIAQGGSSTAAPRAIVEGGFSPLASMAPRAISEEDFSPLAEMLPRAIREVGFSTLAPRAMAEVGSASMELGSMAEKGSLSYPNPDVFTFPQELWGMGFINSSDHNPETPKQVNSFASNYLPTANEQQGYYPMMNQVGVYDQHANANANQYQYQQQFGYPPVVGQVGMNNPSQQQFEYPPVVGQGGMNNPSQQQFEYPPVPGQAGMNNPSQQQFEYPPVVGPDGMSNPNQQQFGYPPVVGQDGMNHPNQSHYQHEQGLVDQRMGFSTVNDNNRYYQHHP